MTTNRVGRNGAFFRELVQDLSNVCGRVAVDLKELESKSSDVENALSELKERSRDWRPGQNRPGVITVIGTSQDPDTEDPQETIAEIRSRLRFALRSLDEAAKLLPDRRSVVVKLVGTD
jgi:hypothetical protein